MVDNESIYFDTLIVNTLEIAQFRKKSIHSTNMMNFKQAIAPLQYTNSCLDGEIYRTKNCQNKALRIAVQNDLKLQHFYLSRPFTSFQ